MPGVGKNRKIIVILGQKAAFFAYFSGFRLKTSRKIAFSKEESGHEFIVFSRQVEWFLKGKEHSVIEFLLGNPKLDFEYKEGGLNFFSDNLFLTGATPPQIYFEMRRVIESLGSFKFGDVMVNGLELWGMLRRGLSSKKNFRTWRDSGKSQRIMDAIKGRTLTSLLCCYSDVYGLTLIGFNDEKLIFYNGVTEGFKEAFLAAKSAILPAKVYAVLPSDLRELFKDEEMFLIDKDPLYAISSSVVRHKFFPAYFLTSRAKFSPDSGVGRFSQGVFLGFVFALISAASIFCGLNLFKMFQYSQKVDVITLKKAVDSAYDVPSHSRLNDAEEKQKVVDFYNNFKAHADAREIFLSLRGILARFHSVKLLDLAVSSSKDGEEKATLIIETSSLEVYDAILALRAEGWAIVGFDILREKIAPGKTRSKKIRLVKINISREL